MGSARKYLCLPLLLASTAFMACDDGPPATGLDGTEAIQGAVAPSPGVVEMLTIALQDEYRAEATYVRVIMDFGEVKPFTRVVNAEGRHVRAVAKRFTKSGLEVPASEWDFDNVPVFETVADACVASVESETATVAMYDAFLLTELPGRVRSVFESLRDASLENHVPAFTRCK